jgi:hypothetical protein
MAFTKEEIEDLLFDAEQLHSSFKTRLKKDKDMDDSSLILYALKASKISQTLLSEVNSRGMHGNNVGWKFDLLKKFQEAYPDFEKK